MTERETPRRILVLDDDSGVVDFLCESLNERGYETVGMTSPTAALERLLREPFDLVVSDIEMPELRGLDLLRAILGQRPSQLVLLITAFGTIELAVASVKAGACDFIAKPFTIEALTLAIERAFTERQLRREIVRLRATRPAVVPGGLIAESRAMRHVLDVARRAARSPSTILVAGEAGTGKSLVARFIHEASGHAASPFIEIDCTTADLEQRLFGSRNDASDSRRGALADVGDGTLVLDEVSALPLDVQATLVDLWEGRSTHPPAHDAPPALPPRIVCTTTRPLELALREGRVRPDLYYRLNVVRIDVPPLRQRTDDLLPLVDLFLGRRATLHDDTGTNPIVGVSASALRRLMHHDWSGNVRELASVIERAVALAEHDTILPKDLDLDPTPHGIAGLAAGSEGIVPLDQVERLYVRHVLQTTGGNKAAAARALRINRRTLYRKMED